MNLELINLLKETENPQIIKDLYNRYRKKSSSKEYPQIIASIFENSKMNSEIESEIQKILQDEKFLNLDFNNDYYYSTLLSSNKNLINSQKLINTLINFSTKDNLILENINKTLDESNWEYKGDHSQKIKKIIKNKLKRKQQLNNS